MPDMSPEQMHAELDKTLEAHDTDKSGTISEAEWGVMITEPPWREMLPPEVLEQLTHGTARKHGGSKKVIRTNYIMGLAAM